MRSARTILGGIAVIGAIAGGSLGITTLTAPAAQADDLGCAADIANGALTGGASGAAIGGLGGPYGAALGAGGGAIIGEVSGGAGSDQCGEVVQGNPVPADGSYKGAGDLTKVPAN